MLINTKYPVKNLSVSQQSKIDRFVEDIRSGEYQFFHRECPLCRKKKCKKIFSNDRYGISVQTVLCKKCGLVYINPCMDEKSSEKFYASDVYRSLYSGDLNQDKFAKRYDFNENYIFDVNYYHANECFFQFINACEIEFQTVCEIGAGGGWNLVPFNLMGKTTIGYEPGTFLVNLGKKYNINLAKGFYKDVEGEYDLVLLRHVLEHFIDPVQALIKIGKHVKKYIAIEVPGLIDRIPKIQSAHLSYFSLNTLTKVLSIADFSKVKMEYFSNNNYIIALFEKKTSEKFDYNYKKEYNSRRNLFLIASIKKSLLGLLKSKIKPG
jgi:methyltransferase family protein